MSERISAMENKEYNKVYDIIRVVATLLVIVGHANYIKIVTNYGGIDYVGIMSANNIAPPIVSKLIGYVITIIYSFHMPLFMALSGAVFSFSYKKTASFTAFVSNKAVRLILPFFLVSIFFSIPLKILSGYYIESENLICDVIIGQLLIQGNTYLWYCPTLFFVSVIIYVVEKKCRIKQGYKLLIFVVVHILSKYITIMILKDICIYLVWFYIGFLFQERKVTLCRKWYFNLLTFVLITLTYIVEFVIEPNIYIVNAINDFLCALAWCVLVYNVCVVFENSKLVNNRAYKMCLKESYGIYLYSDPINYVILYAFYIIGGIECFGSNLIYVCIFLTRVIATLVLAYAISRIVKKFKKKIANNS